MQVFLPFSLSFRFFFENLRRDINDLHYDNRNDDETIAGLFPYKHNEGCNGIYHAACSLQLFMMGLNDYSP